MEEQPTSKQSVCRQPPFLQETVLDEWQHVIKCLILYPESHFVDKAVIEKNSIQVLPEVGHSDRKIS